MKNFIMPNCELIKEWYNIEKKASDKNLLKAESEAFLFTTKFYKYRKLHPINANIVCFTCYKYCYAQYYAKYIDYRDSIVKRGVKQESLYDNLPATINAFVRMRIEADKIGMPYGLYCSFMIRNCIENHIWQHIPLPGQMTVPELVEEVKEMWNNTKDVYF